MRWSICVGFTVLMGAATAVAAQDRPNTILVMDGSGSMWGQIDGVAKITIAQDVVTGLLDSLPDEDRLGLTVYGHRERGNCTDIETIVAPAEGTRDAISAAVQGIKPLGKTPMTDAVIAAAEALRYTEDSATVILVSDGVETCNPDPCAAARLLEEAGIDFTAHVIGFDVGGDAEALLQMQCIADETGGLFIPASDAGELAEALNTVVEEPEPVPVSVTFTAVMGDDARLIDTPIQWDIQDEGVGITDGLQGNPVVLDLFDGPYVAHAYAVALEQSMETAFDVETSGDVTVTVVFPEPEATATLTVPQEAPLGSIIDVSWVGPNGAGDYISIAPVDPNAGSAWRTRVKPADGETLELLLPPREGPHLVGYFQGSDRKMIGQTEIMLTPVEIALDGPDSVEVGTEITVDWIGPDYAGDYIGVGLVDADGAKRWEAFAYTRDGNPAQIRVPSTSGDYQITYFIGQDRTEMRSVPISVTETRATLDAPDSVVAGSTISVGWTGPDLANDYVGIGLVVEDGAKRWENFFYTNVGSPADLMVPVTPGDYLLTYFIGQDRVPVTSKPITVTEVTASLEAPESAIAGSTIEVDWTGPDYENDYVGIGLVGENGAKRWENFFYTDNTDGSADLRVPTKPGDYLIGYYVGQDRQLLTTVAITVTDAVANLSAPDTAIAGSTIQVNWTGPDYENDYVGIGLVGVDGAKRWENFFYTEGTDGTGALVMPAKAGDYLISYYVGQDRTLMTTIPIAVTEIAATLDAPITAVAGSTIQVNWTGPNYENDYVGIGLVGESGAKRWENYFYTKDNDGTSGLQVPPQPGEYLISYYVGQDRTLIASVPITVTEVTATLAAPDTAVAGSTIDVDWTGPDYDNDYIGIGPVDASGASRWENYVYTVNTNGRTALLIPAAAGDYLISYFVGQDRTLLKSKQITVTEIDSVQILAEDSAPAGSDLVIGWDGPDYASDYIGIGKVGASGNNQWQSFGYTTDNNPMTITLPDEPGDYLITYFLGQGRAAVKSRPLTIE